MAEDTTEQPGNAVSEEGRPEPDKGDRGQRLSGYKHDSSESDARRPAPGKGRPVQQLVASELCDSEADSGDTEHDHRNDLPG
ncbi:hypothetical protein [Actinoplanes sp. NPDC089786]|uniref:hypothetical protein n=1 Tax=Actinoplanes sp. NPDC089786 TaxID=3155185 RepID=UPI00344543E9